MLWLVLDNTHFVGLDAFTLGIPTAPSITAQPDLARRRHEPGVVVHRRRRELRVPPRAPRQLRAVEDWTACSSPRAYDLGGEPDGDYTFRVRGAERQRHGRARDRTSTYTLDTTRARRARRSPRTSARSGDDPGASWSFTGEAGATFECRLHARGDGRRRLGGVHEPARRDLSGEPTATYTLEVRATDAAGNPGGTGSADYELDRTAPPPATTSTRRRPT